MNEKLVEFYKRMQSDHKILNEQLEALSEKMIDINYYYFIAGQVSNLKFWIGEFEREFLTPSKTSE